MKSLPELARTPFGAAMAAVALISALSISMVEAAPADSGPANIVTPKLRKQWGVFSYTVKNGGVTIIDFDEYSGSSPDVVFPAKIDGLPVTHLAAEVFQFLTGDDGEPLPIIIRSISIPASVTHIAEGFFYGGILHLQQIIVDPANRNFTSVAGILYDKQKTTLIRFPEAVSGDFSIPDGVKTIANGAFGSCYVTKVQLPDSVARIGIGAFRNCRALENITLPGGLRILEKDAFLGCRSLKSVSIPNSITRIGSRAFFSSGLVSVAIPVNVTRIGFHAFEGCSNLVSIEVAPANSKYSSASGILLNKKKTLLLTCPESIFGAVEIPGSVTSIRDGAFSNCRALTSVLIREGVAEIGKNAFANCSGLKEVTIPRSVKFIKDGAFSECYGLTNVRIPVGVSEIGDQAFAYCSGLKEVTIPGTVSRIGPSAFAFCEALESLTLKTGVARIDQFAFAHCDSLTSVTIPGSVTKMGHVTFSDCRSLKTARIQSAVVSTAMFDGCSNLTSVSLAADTRIIGDRAFGGCGSLTSIIIPAGATTIGDSAFWGCESLKTIGIPSSVTRIGTGAFVYCRSLESIALPSGLASIEDDVFWGCKSLTRVSIPGSVTDIGRQAFFDCTALTEVLLSRGLSRIGVKAFARCENLKQVVFPSSLSRISGIAFSNSGLERTYFKGNAPSMARSMFDDKGVFDGTAPGFTVYFLKSKSGFTTPTWKGYPAVGLDSLPAAMHPAGEVADITDLIPFRDSLSQSGMMAPRVLDGKTWINGRQYLTLTYQKPTPDDGIVRVVEVSPDLIDWFSGPKHTTVVGNSAEIIQVRDNTPIEPVRKRFIRLKTSRKFP